MLVPFVPDLFLYLMAVGSLPSQVHILAYQDRLAGGKGVNYNMQYVGETSQTLRGRFNNHRNRLKQLCGLYLYHHFNSDGHSLDDINIMPTEEVVLEQTDGMTLPSKRLQRGEYWYRELCSVYPYGLNDNVRGVGNVSKSGERLIVHVHIV